MSETRPAGRAASAGCPGLPAQLAWFVVVGGIGFVVDAGLLDTLVQRAGFDPYAGRLASFLVAASTTWLLNRRLTFRSRRRATVREWGRYLAFMVLGALLNLSVYAATVWWLGAARPMLWAGLVLGTLSGMVVNFLSARRVLAS